MDGLSAFENEDADLPAVDLQADFDNGGTNHVQADWNAQVRAICPWPVVGNNVGMVRVMRDMPLVKRFDVAKADCLGCANWASRLQSGVLQRDVA